MATLTQSSGSRSRHSCRVELHRRSPPRPRPAGEPEHDLVRRLADRHEAGLAVAEVGDRDAAATQRAAERAHRHQRARELRVVERRLADRRDHRLERTPSRARPASSGGRSAAAACRAASARPGRRDGAVGRRDRCVHGGHRMPESWAMTEPTIRDVDALIGPATPHFAYQIRQRVDEPRRRPGRVAPGPRPRPRAAGAARRPRLDDVEGRVGRPIEPAVTLALKEWHVVVEAIARGDQVVTLRKGGIARSRSPSPARRSGCTRTGSTSRRPR